MKLNKGTIFLKQHKQYKSIRMIIKIHEHKYKTRYDYICLERFENKTRIRIYKNLIFDVHEWKQIHKNIYIFNEN